MKYFAFLTLFFVSTLSAKTLPPVDRVISAIEITQDFVMKLINGEYPNVAVEIQEGAAIPVHFLVKSPFTIFECNPNLTVKVTKTTYLRADKKRIYMSEDLVNWEKAEKFFQGNCESIVRMSDDQSHAIVEFEIQ